MREHSRVSTVRTIKIPGVRLYFKTLSVDLLQKNVLKGTRWLLLKNPENLKDDRNEKTRLEEALSLNKPLATA